MDVKIRSKAKNTEVTVQFNFGDTLAAMIKLFGEESVFNHAQAKMKIGAQNFGRALLDAGKSPEEVKKAIASWKPGVTVAVPRDPVAAIAAKYAKLSDEEKKVLIKSLMGK